MAEKGRSAGGEEIFVFALVSPSELRHSDDWPSAGAVYLFFENLANGDLQNLTADQRG
jgi:hypothetical protein